MNNTIQQTTVTFTVFSREDIGGLTLQELGDKIDSDLYLSSELDCLTTTLSPMEAAAALNSLELDRESLLGRNTEETQPHIRVDYDLSYSGGDYSNLNVASFAFIPQHKCDEKFKGNVKEAFHWWTGIDPVHITRFDRETQYTFDGGNWDYE